LWTHYPVRPALHYCITWRSQSCCSQAPQNAGKALSDGVRQLEKREDIAIVRGPVAIIADRELWQRELREDVVADGTIGPIELDQPLESAQGPAHAVWAGDLPVHLIRLPRAPTRLTHRTERLREIYVIEIDDHRMEGVDALDDPGHVAV